LTRRFFARFRRRLRPFVHAEFIGRPGTIALRGELTFHRQTPKGAARRMRPQSFGEKGGGQMDKSKRSFAVALGVAGAIALGAANVSAAPVMSSTATLKAAAPSDLVQVRSRSGRTAAAAGIGFAAGALIGAAASSHAYAYSDPYWYGYGPSYTYASTCYWGDPWCNGHFGATFAAPAPAYIEPAPVYAGPAPVVVRRVVPRQLFLDANPALGTIHGASGVD